MTQQYFEPRWFRAMGRIYVAVWCAWSDEISSTGGFPPSRYDVLNAELAFVSYQTSCFGIETSFLCRLRLRFAFSFLLRPLRNLPSSIFTFRPDPQTTPTVNLVEVFFLYQQSRIPLFVFSRLKLPSSVIRDFQLSLSTFCGVYYYLQLTLCPTTKYVTCTEEKVRRSTRSSRRRDINGGRRRRRRRTDAATGASLEETRGGIPHSGNPGRCQWGLHDQETQDASAWRFRAARLVWTSPEEVCQPIPQSSVVSSSRSTQSNACQTGRSFPCEGGSQDDWMHDPGEQCPKR